MKTPQLIESQGPSPQVGENFKEVNLERTESSLMKRPWLFEEAPEVIRAYLERSTWRIKENANFNYSYSGLLSHVANTALVEYGLKSMPRAAAEAHLSGELHLHNLESGCLVPYCHGGSLFALLQKGIDSVSIVSKPAKHFNAVVDHIANYFMMSQLEFSGAQSFSDFDTLLAPFVYYDKLSYGEVKQNIQRLIFNLNFTSRNSYQSPFTNFSFNLLCPSPLEDVNVIIGGEAKEEKYGDFVEESMLINRAFAEVLMEGDASGRPFTFPIPTLNITKNFPWTHDTVTTIFEEIAALGSYYFMNYVGTGYEESTIRAMCCRLNLDLTKLQMPKGLFYAGEGTGSLGVATINLPRLGYTSKSEDDLYDELDRLLQIARDFLLSKAERILESMEHGLMPFTTAYGLNLNNYFCTIGLLGINEFCLNFTGEDITGRGNVKLVKDILLHIRAEIEEYQRRYNRLFNLELVPGEGSSYRLALLDRKKFEGIKTLGTETRPYYTSLIVPPQIEIGLLDKLKIEEETLPIFTGGTVCRLFLGEKPDNGSLVSFVRRLIEYTKIPYSDVTSTFSVCIKEKKHHRGAHEVCPDCGSKTEIFSRVVGYYRPVHKWNLGKQQEFSERLYFSEKDLAHNRPF